MSTLRFKAVEEAFKKKALCVSAPEKFTSDYYGKYVFNNKRTGHNRGRQRAEDCNDRQNRISHHMFADNAALGQLWILPWQIKLLRV